MKRLLTSLLLLLSFAASAQVVTPFVPQFKRKLPPDSIAIVGIGSTNLSFKLPDTSWVKKYTSTYFEHGFLVDSGTRTNPFRIANGYITPAMLHSISGVPGSGTVYYGDGHWGAVSASAVWGAITGTLSAQTDLQSALNAKVPTSRTLTINGVVHDLSADRSFTIASGDSTIYKADGSITDAIRNVNIGANQLNFIAKSGSDSTGVAINSSLFDVATTNGASISEISTFADNAGMYTSEASTGNSANILTQTSGGFTHFNVQVVDAGSSTNTGIDISTGTGSVPGVVISDGRSHVGLIGDALFPVYSGKQYAQIHQVDSTAKAKADSVKGTITSGSTTQSLTFNNSGTGDASGSTFNGSAAKTLSYNSIGAVSASSTATFTNKSGNISQWTNDAGYLTTTPTYTASNGVVKTSNNFTSDTTYNRTVANSYSLAAMQTKLNNYTLQTRNVNTSTGLTGGGALSADLTLKADTTLLSTKYYASTVVGVDGIVSGLVTTTVTTTATTTAGTYRLNNLLVTKGSSTNTTIPAQDATLNRYTLIVGDASGVFTAVNGTLAADAVEPDIPANKALIASIYIPATGGTVTTGGGGSGNGTVKNALNGGYGIIPFSFNGGTSGIKVVADTAKIQTITNFFPKGDTRYLKISTASTTYALQSTTVSAGLGLSGGGSLAANRTLSADTTILKSKAGFLTDYNNLSTRINAKGVGSVTSVAAGTGMSFTTITGSGTVNADTTVLRTVANSKTLAQEQTALNLKANLASPVLTGTPTAPTATVGTNTTQIATTAFVLANAGGSGAPSVELYPHTIATGSGTEGSPYTHADSTAGIQTQISALSAGRGGGIILSTSRFNITKSTGIVIDTTSIKIQGVVSGFNKDVDALNQGTKGTSLIVSGNKGIVIKGVDATHRTGGTLLSRLYLFGTTTLQSVGSSTGTIGINLQSWIDQPNLQNINLGGFDYGIKLTNSGIGYVDLAYYDKINILGGRLGMWADAGGNAYQKIINSTFADQLEQNLYVTLNSANQFWEITNCTFVRGSGGAGVTNGANVYFGGYYSKITNSSFEAAGKYFITNTQRIADGLIVAGNYNSITNCSFTTCTGSGSAGVRITGDNNILSACVFSGNSTDIIITGNNNTIFVSGNETITNSGTGNTIISKHLVLTPTVSGAIAQGASWSNVLSPIANNNLLYGLDITNAFTGGLGTVSITTGGSSYTNGTYTSVPLVSTGATGGLATVVVSGGAVTSVTVTTAGSGYVIFNNVTIAAANIGGTGSGFSSRVATFNFTGVSYAGARIDGITFGRGGGYWPNNISIGDGSTMKSNTTGQQDIVIGLGTGGNITSATNATIVGNGAGAAVNTATDITMLGFSAGGSVTSATKGTYIGSSAGNSNSTSTEVTAVGYGSLGNATGSFNTGVGSRSGNGSGSQNTFLGALAGANNSSGSNNTYAGVNSGLGITTGSQNTILGSQIQGLTSSLANNVIVGDGAGAMRFVSDASGRIYLGAGTTYPTIPAVSKFTVENSTTMGTMPWTRMTTAQRTAITATEALTVYDTDLHKLMVYDGTIWQAAW